MASVPLVAIEAATGSTGSDGLTVFTFSADIDTSAYEIYVDRLRQGSGVDFSITAARQITFVAPNIPLAGAQIWLFNGVQASAVSTSLPGWDTVANLISDAAIELGLVSAAIADPFVSTDVNVLQLVKFLKSGGRELAARREWKHLVKEYTFATANGTESYGLPSDFRSMVADTGWDRSTQIPLGGPLSPADWQLLKAVTSTGIFKRYRLWAGRLYLNPIPTSIETIAYEYNGTSWVKPSGQTSPTSSTPSAASDVICFDPLLVVKRLKRDFRRAKKQDSASEEDDYREGLNLAELGDSDAATIFIGGRRNGVRRIDRYNVPDTGVGG
jgi:hypothetical protein